MSGEIVKTLAGSSVKLTNATGFSAIFSGAITVILDFFGSNASSIGAMCTLATCIAFIYFSHKSSKRYDEKDRQSLDNKAEIDKLKQQLRKATRE